MKREAFLKELRFSETPRGKRVDLAFYIYPNGYGNVYNLGSGGKWARRGRDEVAISFVDLQDALSVLRDVLEVAAGAATTVHQKSSTKDKQS